MPTHRVPVTDAMLLAAAASAEAALRPLSAADWSVAAGDLEWSARDTLDHMVNVEVNLASFLASRARTFPERLRRGDPEASVDALLSVLGLGAAVLAEVARAAPSDVRAFHRLGMADPEGFVAMACDEVLVHAYDVAAGVGAQFDPPRDVCRAVVERLFPWIAVGGQDPWPLLLWANGRIGLEDRERLDPHWGWHCAPLEEWDGRIPQRRS